jgi:hypothetical protein
MADVKLAFPNRGTVDPQHDTANTSPRIGEEQSLKEVAAAPEAMALNNNNLAR